MIEKRIDPGEGWRLLEPGEVVKEGDEYCSKSRGKWIETINIGGRATRNHYRRRISPPESPWIPVSEQPLPESGYAWLAYRDGTHSSAPTMLKDVFSPHSIVAYILCDKPEPFVPPEPEILERREEWVVHCDQYRRQAHSRHSTEHDARQMAAAVNGQYHLKREVLPGDVDPDAAIKAREYAESSVGVWGGTYKQACRDILEILNGGQP